MDLKRSGDWERVNAVLRMQEFIEDVYFFMDTDMDTEDLITEEKKIELFKSYFRSSGDNINYGDIKQNTKIILYTHDWLCFLYAIIKNINCIHF